MALLKGLLAIAVLAALAGGVTADEDPLRVETSLDRRTIAIGDTFNLNLDLEWQQGVEVKPLAVADRVGDFAVRDLREGLVSSREGGMARRISLLLAIFETGTHTVPALPIIYVEADGTTGRVETRPMDVDVESVLPEDAAEIRDIKPPISVPKRWKDLIMSYALLVGLAAGAALSVLFSVKRREELEALFQRVARMITDPIKRLVIYLLSLMGLSKAGRGGARLYDVEVIEPDIAPEEAALKELDRIEALGLLERGMTKDLYTLVSETVRRYLERKYGVLAMESPTSYTMHVILEIGVATAASDLILEVLEEGDLVKFAKYLPPVATVATLLGRARDVIRLTAGEPAYATSEEVRSA